MALPCQRTSVGIAISARIYSVISLSACTYVDVDSIIARLIVSSFVGVVQREDGP